YRENYDWTLSKLKDNLSKKTKSLLIPTIVFGTIFSICIYPFSREEGYSRFQSIGSMIIDPFKHGYWFTLALFEMFILFYLGDFFLKKKSVKNRTIVWVIISIVLYVLSFYTTKQYIVENGYFEKTLENYYYLAFNITSLNKTFYYFQWFMFGILLRKHWNEVVQHIKTGYIITFSLILYIPLLLINRYNSDPIISNITFALLGYEAIIILFSFFYLYQSISSTEYFWGSGLQAIGKRTLDIYMIHYFFIPSLLEVGNWFKTPNNDIANKILPELIVGFVFSLGVIGLCLIISKIIRMSPFFSQFLFGSKKEE
ncbi:MAG: hypothetical protein SPK94_04300, partial [Bacteroidales bacterium]|nr:hypothetical protein [Bacteroidales bacterium]